MEDFTDPQGVAQLANVPLRTVYAWRSKGYLPPAYRLGKHVRWRRSDIEAWLEAHRETEPAA